MPSAVTGAVIGGAFGVFVAVTSATGLPAFDGIVGGAIGGTVGGIAGGIIGCVSGAILGCVDRIAVRRVVIGACSAAGIGVGASLGMLLVIPPVVTMVVKALNARIAKRFNFKKDSLSGELASVNSGAGE
ncbi:MAG: hypothetical protein LBF94_03425 [Puniceicoccales bacterium]|nr:hypothetical protein [Puniceicoccales bacterium]